MDMVTTLEKLQSRTPGVYKRMLIEFGKEKADDEPISVLEIFDSLGFEAALGALNAVDGGGSAPLIIIKRLGVEYMGRLRAYLPEKYWHLHDVMVRYHASMVPKKELESARLQAQSLMKEDGHNDQLTALTLLLNEQVTNALHPMPEGRVTYRVSCIVLAAIPEQSREEEKKAQERLFLTMLTGCPERLSARQKRSISIKDWSRPSPSPVWNW